jgi:glutathione S-transferase
LTTGAMQFPEELTLFRKALFTLAEVVSDVSGRASLIAILARAGAVEFVRELLRRLPAPLDSRDFGSHISNADLICAWTAAVFIAPRFWIATFHDALDAWARAGKPRSGG